MTRTPFFVGNDVVDLAHSRCQHKSDDERFLTRVFTAEERARILEAEDPGRTLWLHWAAKEAAFKVVSKVRGSSPPFVHSRFRVMPAAGGREGSVLYEGETVPWRLDGRTPPGCLHVLAWTSPARELGSGPPGASGLVAVERGVARLQDTAEIPRERFTHVELPGIHTPSSAWVRIHARAHLADVLGRAEGEIEIVRSAGEPDRAPPRALVDGRPTDWDVSLSHHGRWLAWALAPGG